MYMKLRSHFRNLMRKLRQIALHTIKIGYNTVIIIGILKLLGEI